MDHDLVKVYGLAEMAGISHQEAKREMRGAYLWRAIPHQDARKIAARARFAQRVAKRHDKRNEQIADSMRPRVIADMGGAK
jgi:hypothetical protein